MNLKSKILFLLSLIFGCLQTLSGQQLTDTFCLPVRTYRDQVTELQILRVEKQNSDRKDSIIDFQNKQNFLLRKSISLIDSSLNSRTNQANIYGFENQGLKEKVKRRNTAIEVLGVILAVIIAGKVL